MSFRLFAVACITLGLTFIAKLTSAVVACRFVIIRRRPPRAIATEVPSIAPLFFPIATSHSEPSTQDNSTRIIALVRGMSRPLSNRRWWGRIGVWDGGVLW